MHKLVALAFVLCFSAVLGARSAAEIFQGSFSFINSSQVVDGVHIPVSVGRIGTINYYPAFPGALYGNMSVVYGIPREQDPNLDCLATLNGFSAYTGPYQVFEKEGYVAHYPIVTSNPKTGHTPNNVPAIRYFQSYDNDNIISVESRPDITFIYWRRVFPFPAGPACTVSAVATPSGNSWVENGVSKQVYTLTVQNTGASVVTGAQVQINLPATASIVSSWNLVASGNYYTVPVYSGLAPGQTSTSAGFIVAGASNVNVAVPPTLTVCN